MAVPAIVQDKEVSVAEAMGQVVAVAQLAAPEQVELAPLPPKEITVETVLRPHLIMQPAAVAVPVRLAQTELAQLVALVELAQQTRSQDQALPALVAAVEVRAVLVVLAVQAVAVLVVAVLLLELLELLTLVVVAVAVVKLAELVEPVALVLSLFVLHAP